MRGLSLCALALSHLLLSGCIVSTAADIVTAPVKVVGSGVDAVTTSQSEADEKRGRELRKQEEELGKLQREYEKQHERCRDGNDRACFEARETYSEMQILLRNWPELAGSPPQFSD